jgi:hypothetical protein
VKSLRLGAGMAFWGDSIRGAIDLVENGDIDYLCCDHLAELTMSILNKQMARDPSRGYTADVLDLMRAVLPTCQSKGIKVITNAGGANPRACAEAVAAICTELNLSGVKIALVTGDDIRDRIDEFVGQDIPFTNMDTDAELETVRDRLTHASVYTGSEGIVEALKQGADVVICGRVTDVALYIGPMIVEFGWATDDWHHLGIAAGIAHAAECGGQATGGLYSAGWDKVPGMEEIGYPIIEVSEDGTAYITKTSTSGGEVTVGTVSEQMVYEILDPGNYLTADVTGDFSQITLEEVAPNRVKISGLTGREAPATLKVNMGYKAGFIGEVQFSYSWPDAYRKSQRALEFLRERLARVQFVCEDERVEYVGHNSLWGELAGEPNADDDLNEVVVRYATRCANADEARKVFTASVPLYNNGPAGVAGIGTRPPLKELFAIWSSLIPRDRIEQHVDMVVSS